MNPRFALVTGAASGIGQATAKALIQAGWTVGVADVALAAIQETTLQLGPRAVAIEMDVTDSTSVWAGFEKFGTVSGDRLDLLVNNAGLLYMGKFEEQQPVRIARLLSVNNLGVALCCQAALPLLKESAMADRGATVINIASASGVVGIPSMATYSASKFWVRGFTEALATEWKHHGITVRDVFPPFVDTPMLAAGQGSTLIKNMGVDLSPEEVAREVMRSVQGGSLHRFITLKLKALVYLTKWLPGPVMRAVVAKLAGY